MLCHNCGSFCEEDVKICPTCGVSLEHAYDPSALEMGNTDPNTMDEAALINSMVEQPQYAEMEPYAPAAFVRKKNSAPKKYKRGIALCLIAAALFVCGAVVLLIFSTSDAASKLDQAMAMEENKEAGIVGTWARDGDFAVFTSDGRFAVPEDKGNYDLSGSDILLSTSKSYSVAKYSIDDNTLTIKVSGVGTEHEYKYRFVSPQVDLKPSEIQELWKKSS